MTTEIHPPHLQRLADDFVDAGMNEMAARILVSALRLFAEKGYAATSVREIVREAQVTNPMLYYYFDSKEGVFISLMEILIEQMERAVEEGLEQQQSFEDRLRAIASAHFEACQDAPEVLRVVYSTIFGPLHSRPSYDIVESYSAIHQIAEHTIQQAIDDGEFAAHPNFTVPYLAEHFMGLIGNNMMNVLTVCDHTDCRDQLKVVIDQYLGDEALDLMMEFYFHGAGSIEEKR